MGLMVFFFDSYAIIEMLENGENYSAFKEEQGIMFQFNLIEVYYHYYATSGEEIAKKIYAQLKSGVVEVPEKVVFEAVKFKKQNAKKNLSYIDCLGYIYAKMHKMKFLTGDNAFNGMDNVEFVK
jgi:predicted nucleic acid-binding protein